MNYLYQVVQILYWLLLATWLGGMVFLSLAAPVVFYVLRRMNVRVPSYTSPELEEEHATIASGELMGALLARMAQIQMVCAMLLLPLMLAQALLIDLTGPNLIATAIRFFLWLLAVLLLAYEWRVHYPRTWRFRREFLDSAGSPEKAQVAREAFEREHRRSELVFQVTLFCLVGMVMFSANITPRGGRPATPPLPVPPTLAK